MSTPASWNETAAGLLLHGGLQVEPPGEARAREFASPEARAARIGFAARLASDVQWQEARAVQQELAERGRGPSAVLQIPDTRPAALKPLWVAQEAREAVRTGTFVSGRPADDVAREIAEHQRQRQEAAKLRQAHAG